MSRIFISPKCVMCTLFIYVIYRSLQSSPPNEIYVRPFDSSMCAWIELNVIMVCPRWCCRRRSWEESNCAYRRVNETRFAFTPPPFASSWLLADAFYSICHILLASWNMSDLYSSLQVSPKKKRCPPSDDEDTLLTPKRLRTKYVVLLCWCSSH